MRCMKIKETSVAQLTEQNGNRNRACLTITHTHTQCGNQRSEQRHFPPAGKLRSTVRCVFALCLRGQRGVYRQKVGPFKRRRMMFPQPVSLELSVPRPMFDDQPGKTRMPGLRYHGDVPRQDGAQGVSSGRPAKQKRTD